MRRRAERRPRVASRPVTGVLIMLAANNERQFVDLCAVLGHPEWPKTRVGSNPNSGQKIKSALRAVMENAFRDRSAAEWETLCDQAGVPASRVRLVGEVLAEGQPEARDLLRELSVGTGVPHPVSLPGIGFRLNGDSLQPQQAPRISGQDNGKYLT